MIKNKTIAAGPKGLYLLMACEHHKYMKGILCSMYNGIENRSLSILNLRHRHPLKYNRAYFEVISFIDEALKIADKYNVYNPVSDKDEINIDFTPADIPWPE